MGQMERWEGDIRGEGGRLGDVSFGLTNLLRRRFGCEVSLQRECEHLFGEDDKCLGNFEH